MCFSAAASFSASAVCAAAGVMAIRRADRADLPLALIPMIFALHQAIEGLVWMTHAEGWGRHAGYAFAIIAFCLWPVYVPIASWLSELDARRRKFMLFFVGLGAVIALLAAQVLYFGLIIDFATHQIQYLPTTPYPLIFDYLYTACVVGPFWMHRSPYMKIFGCLILAFFAVSTLYFNPARYSVWCFFAALSSVVVYLFIRARAEAGEPGSAAAAG